MLSAIEKIDPTVAELIQGEKQRQDGSIRMIPSENYVSQAVMQATGSCLTNKYAEGYPGKRYYEGQQFTDQIENLARERAMKLFGAEAANVQTLSGSPANLATYCALAETGTLVLLSGEEQSATTSLLPETHIAIVPTGRIVVSMEDVWELMRNEVGELPRQVNFISGPSRTADIEMTLVYGAHGPFRVHVLLLGE